MTAIQTISFIGGLIGIATGIFVLFDRVLRNRPLANVVLKGNQHNPLHYVRVKNVGAIDVIVFDIKANPRSFEISTDHSVRGLAGAIMDKPSFAILPPGAEQHFPFFSKTRNGRGRKNTREEFVFRSTGESPAVHGFVRFQFLFARLPGTYNEWRKVSVRCVELCHERRPPSCCRYQLTSRPNRARSG